MGEVPSPSIEVGELHELSDEQACALVDHHLGAPSNWGAELVRWRLEHPSQRDWKVEVGHFSNSTALTMRLGYPCSLGFSFMP